MHYYSLQTHVKTENVVQKILISMLRKLAETGLQINRKLKVDFHFFYVSAHNLNSLRQ